MPGWEAEVNFKTPKSPLCHQQKHIKVNISENR